MMSSPAHDGSHHEILAEEDEEDAVMAPRRTKGTYERVASSVDAADEEARTGLVVRRTGAASTTKTDSTDTQSSTESPRWQRALHKTLLPDMCFAFRNIRVLDGVEAVRFWKFFCVTAILIMFIHAFVRWADLERDMDYTLSDLVLYDGHGMVLDMMAFYAVGRLFQERGVDHPAWVGMALLGGMFPSIETNFSFLRYSLSLYSVHCLWPYTLWFYVIFILVFVSILVHKHVQYAIRTRGVVVKAVEVILTVLLLLAPQLSSPSFHFHHWYAGFLLGMHCNYNTWWSRAAMAYCWGLYCNGIAVYGRDPTLTCAYGYFISIDSGCPYLECFLLANATTHTAADYQPLPTPDWRNCSAIDNYNP